MTHRRYHSPQIQTRPDNWKVLDAVDWQRPVVVEVGCGTGDWILSEAQRVPETQFVAIERTQNRSDKLLHQAGLQHLSNLIALRADAVWVLDQCFPPESVDEFYFFYPNPWPKKRQANRRFFAGPTAEVFDRCLKPGGQLYLATNIEDYAKETAENLRSIWGYSVAQHGLITSLATPRTAFERKYIARGEPLFEVMARKP